MKLSCNGCRALRKGCSEDCIIKPCLEWISSPEAQGHATLFLAKFYGRTGLLNLLANATNQKAQVVFKSLLYEAAGRLVNPTHGALGLFWIGQWSRCEATVESVLTGSNINDVTTVDGQTSSGTLIPENHVLPTTSDIRHVARGTNVDIKEKTQFKRAGSIFKPKPRVGWADNATLLKSILENGSLKIVEASSMIEKELNGAAETQVNFELTLGFNCQSSNDKKSYDN
ncbi:LOB domain-containing protein 42-like [Trifolium pratense]|uniref:LOB domain-containing protein 42-like n=1 Tax=Trifolium pratense TaxID=57577 RepID=UPI001E696FB6|nr:LOB domain-containing protein 42-like [Trifolium pratense]